MGPGREDGPVSTAEAAIRHLPPQAARMAAVAILLADPDALDDDVLESCLYVPREAARVMTAPAQTWRRTCPGSKNGLRQLMRTLAGLGLEAVLCELDEARGAYDQVVPGEDRPRGNARSGSSHQYGVRRTGVLAAAPRREPVTNPCDGASLTTPQGRQSPTIYAGQRAARPAPKILILTTIRDISDGDGWSRRRGGLDIPEVA
jgi:hypothetical protein